MLVQLQSKVCDSCTVAIYFDVIVVVLYFTVLCDRCIVTIYFDVKVLVLRSIVMF